jgi:hypothetical protein
MNTPSFSKPCLLIPSQAWLSHALAVSANYAAALLGAAMRGGIRVIYFLRTRQGQIWMLTLYPKNVAENIPAHVLKQIKDEIDG